MRRRGRVAEGGGLLNRYTLQRRIQGSNPCVSARFSGSESLHPATARKLIRWMSTAARPGRARPSIGRLFTPLDGGMDAQFLSRLSYGICHSRLKIKGYLYRCGTGKMVG